MASGAAAHGRGGCQQRADRRLAAAAIGAVELAGGKAHGSVLLALAVIGGIIGAISFSGSLIAFGKLQALSAGAALARRQLT